MLNEQISKDFTNALKNKDDFTLSILRMLKAAMLNAAIEKRRKELESDEEVVEVLKREVKKLKDSLIDFKNGGRQDLVEKAEKEIAVLEKYFPAQASEEKIKEVVKKVIDEMYPSGPPASAKASAGRQDFGKVMGAAMKDLKGAADGAVVKKAVEELLK